MSKIKIVATSFSNEDIRKLIESFDDASDLIYKGRNTIKTLQFKSRKVAIKSFKSPSFINKIIYSYFRKSKAKRSYEYAQKLKTKKIGTPQPIAFVEEYDFWGLNRSFYISEFIDAQLTYRELVEEPNFPNHETILRQFTHFCFQLHENGIEFLDHSPGNTLITQISENLYSFALVDLNRMKFHNKMDLDKRMFNLRRLTPKKEMVVIMSNEYAKYVKASELEIFEKLWKQTSIFQEKYFRKKRLKKKFLFWKK